MRSHSLTVNIIQGNPIYLLSPVAASPTASTVTTTEVATAATTVTTAAIRTATGIATVTASRTTAGITPVGGRLEIEEFHYDYQQGSKYQNK
jgi:hypothetical protein